MSDQTTPVEETLAWEADHRRTASAGAIVGGLVLLIGVVIQSLALAGAPRIALLTVLRQAETIEKADLRISLFRYISDHGSALLFGAVLQGGGYAAAILGVGFLFRATRARRPELRRWVLGVLLIGLGLLAVTTVVQEVSQVSKAHAFVHGHDFSHHAAEQVINDNGVLRASSFLSFAAALMSLVGVVLLALNAMRSGLLTKFIGTVGIISGVAFIFGGGVLIIIFVLWLLMIGTVIGGHWPGGVPPAWASGKQEPWPTAQEIREQRDAAAGKAPREGRGSTRGGGRSSTPAPEPDDELPSGVPTPAPHPSSKKRKRKRR